ncbi:transcription factor bhlh120 [Phtheirospermum japonicum]|uniref:Transcription factor bhlh120 n=1 Tax=Phtheirospermum japonicum TaxID=374723 RepID=A0A830CR81_9LAMI|nr:transcription factor bhlh120 [Phtheirospermum japonicum]
MFPLQSDGLVLEVVIPSYSDEQDKILEDLLADCAALGGTNEINNNNNNSKGVKKRQRNKLDEDSDRKTRKSMHRDVERQRRQEMSGLYATLRSLLPLEYIKGKRAVTDQLQQAANYISHMQEKIEKMQMRRDKLKKKMFGGDAEEPNKSNIRDCVKVSLCRGGVEILIGISSGNNNEESWALSRVLADLVGRPELNVTSCVSTRASDQRSLHKIQIEVNDPTSIDLPELQKRLVNLIH